jgi:hypothetical protein
MSESCCVKSIADLKALSAVAFHCVQLLGYYAPGDGGGGEFYWDEAASEPDNGGTVIAVIGIATGRWRRLIDHSTYDIRWFGAWCDGIRPDTLAINATVSAAQLVNGTVYLPAGKRVKLTHQITITAACTIYSDGATIIPALVSAAVGLNNAFYVKASNVTIDGLAFDYTGLQTGTELDSCMLFVAGADDGHHLSNVTLKNCRITNIMTGDFPNKVLACTAIWVQWCDNFVIENNYIRDVSGFGIEVVKTNHGTIIGNTLIDTGWASISLNSGCFDTIIRANRITGTTVGRRDEGGSIDIPSTASNGYGANVGVIVSSNYISGYVNYGSAVRVGSTAYIDIEGNIFDQIYGLGPPGAGPAYVSFSTRDSQPFSCAHVRVRGNVFIAPPAAQVVSPGMVGVEVQNKWQKAGVEIAGAFPGRNVIISDNQFVSADGENFFAQAVLVHGQNGGWQGVAIHDNQGYGLATAEIAGFCAVIGTSSGPVTDVDIHDNRFTNIGSSDSNQIGIFVGQYTSRVHVHHNIVDSWQKPYLYSQPGSTDVEVWDQKFGASSTLDLGAYPTVVKVGGCVVGHYGEVQGTVNTQSRLSSYSPYGYGRTTNNMPTMILSIGLTGGAFSGIVRVTGRDVSTGDAFSFEQLAQFKNISGTVSVASRMAAAEASFDASMASCTVSYGISGTTIAVLVTGVTARTIDWTATIVGGMYV